MTIEFILPVMRPKSALLVLSDLANQTTLIDKITIVDNGGDFKLDRKYPFEIKLLKPKRNIGVNPIWNLAFKMKSDFIGFIGDDFRLDKNLIKMLIQAHSILLDVGATSPIVFADDVPLRANVREIQGRPVPGKGHFGVVIFKKCTLDCLPKIPKEFKIFFGDDFLGWWIQKLGLFIYEISVGVIHKHKLDLKEKLDYATVIEDERLFWKGWLRREIIL